MYEKSSVKQESQRRTRSATVPERSVVSSMVVQKQVGQTIVQLAQARQRSATSSQRGWLGVGLQQFFEPVSIEGAPHRLRVRVTTRSAAADFGFGCRPVRQALAARSMPAALPTSITKTMTAFSINSVNARSKPALTFGPGIHRGAKAGSARLTTIDRDDKGLVTSTLVDFVDVRALDKDPVLNGDRAQFAGAHADKSQRLCRFLVFDDRHETIALMRRACHSRSTGGCRKLLPGMRPDSIAEQRRVGAPLEAVFAGVLSIGPADRQLIEDRNGVVDDSPVANGRADHPIAAAREAADNLLQHIPLDRDLGAEPARRRA